MDRRNLVADFAALAVCVVVMNPAWSGVGFHEWIGLVLFAVVFVHCVLHADWTSDAVSGIARRASTARLGSLALAALLLVSSAVAMVSGILISGAVLPALGLYADGYYFWDPLHAISAKVLLAVLIIHVAAHWKWLYGFFRRGKSGRIAGNRPKGDLDGSR